MRRFVRQVSLPEIGEAGQRRLAARPLAPPSGDPRAGEIARVYLERAGIAFEPSGAPCPVPGPDAVLALAGVLELEEAAAFLAGAFAAVEQIKATLEVGLPGSLEAVRLAEPEAPA